MASLHAETSSLVNHPESGKPPSAGFIKQDSTASNFKDRDCVVRPHISKGPNRLYSARLCEQQWNSLDLWNQSSKPQIRTKGPHTAWRRVLRPLIRWIIPALHRSIVETFTFECCQAISRDRFRNWSRRRPLAT
jgi:hypothetical protein